MSSLRSAFDDAHADARAALVGYLPAGFPSVAGGIRAAKAMVAGGVDIVEVGWPYSDPLMDGPTIQDAVHTALEAGTRAADVLATVETLADAGVTTAVMTYWNPVERYGADRFARDLAAAGGAGVITPDLTPEEAGPWLAAARQAGVNPVFLVAPSSTEERIATVAGVSRGFLYAASTMGVTGARGRISGQAADLVSRVRGHTGLPVAVGLGVSTGQQAAEVAGFADGVIVGSALVRALMDAGGDTGAQESAVRSLAVDLAGGVRAAAGSVGGPR